MLRVGDLVIDRRRARAFGQLVGAEVRARGVVHRDQRVRPPCTMMVGLPCRLPGASTSLIPALSALERASRSPVRGAPALSVPVKRLRRHDHAVDVEVLRAGGRRGGDLVAPRSAHRVLSMMLQRPVGGTPLPVPKVARARSRWPATRRRAPARPGGRWRRSCSRRGCPARSPAHTRWRTSPPPPAWRGAKCDAVQEVRVLLVSRRGAAGRAPRRDCSGCVVAVEQPLRREPRAAAGRDLRVGKGCRSSAGTPVAAGGARLVERRPA